MQVHHLGFYKIAEEAARAYDAVILTIKPSGKTTNFDYSDGATPLPQLPQRVATLARTLAKAAGARAAAAAGDDLQSLPEDAKCALMSPSLELLP